MIEIEYKDKTKKEKLNFFVRYIFFAADFMESIIEIKFDSHKTLLNKILYQIKFNEPNYDQYLDSYFKHEYLKRNDVYLKKKIRTKQSLRHLLTTIEQYPNSSKKILREWINQNKNGELLDLKNEIEKNYIKDIIANLVSLLRSKTKLRYCIPKIVYYSNILISELKLVGYHPVSIMNFISSVVRKESYGYPFPKKIKTKEQKKEYLAKATIFTSIKNISNIFNDQSHEQTYIFRVLNFTVPDNNFYYEYNDVKLIGPNHSLLDKIKQREAHKNFLESIDCVIAIVKVKFHIKKEFTQGAFQKVKKVINFLNAITEHEGVLDRKNFLQSSDGNNFGGRSLKDYETSLKLKAANYYTKTYGVGQYLNSINSSTKTDFLNYEHLFIDAFNGLTAEVKLSGMWQYMEAIIKMPFIEKTSFILIGNEKEYLERLLCHYFYSVTVNSLEQKGLIQKKLREGDFTSAYKLILKEDSYPIFKYIINRFTKFNPIRYEKILELYKYHLKQLQGVRNFYFHKGVRSYEVELIEIEIPQIISRFRKIWLKKIQSNDCNQTEELMKDLTRRGRNLIQHTTKHTRCDTKSL